MVDKGVVLARAAGKVGEPLRELCDDPCKVPLSEKLKLVCSVPNFVRSPPPIRILTLGSRESMPLAQVKSVRFCRAMQITFGRLPLSSGWVGAASYGLP
jgi:hypothetical protein